MCLKGHAFSLTTEGDLYYFRTIKADIFDPSEGKINQKEEEMTTLSEDIKEISLKYNSQKDENAIIQLSRFE